MAERPAGFWRSPGELIGLFGLAVLAACARDAPAPLPVLPVEAVSVAAYGPAEIEAAEGALRVAPAGEGEVGFLLGIGDGVEWPGGALAAAVTVRLEAAAPWSIREGGAGGYAYSSTADRRHVILGRNAAEPALIFTALPGAHRLQIEKAEWCAEIANCPTAAPAGAKSVATGPKGAVIVEAYGPAVLSEADGGLNLVSSEDAEIGFRISLAGDVRWPKGAQSAAVKFALESDRPWSVREMTEGARAYSSTEAHDFVRLTKAQNESPLIYARAPGPHRLVVTDIIWCRAGSRDWRCRTKEEFLALLPPAREPGSIEGMLDLLEWATRNADFAGSRSIVDQFYTSSLGAHEIFFRFFERDNAGAYCGGQSVFLSRLLRERDFRAFTFNFGILDEDLTHVTTIVASGGEYFLLDSTFGLYLADPSSGRPLDVFSALDGAPYSLRHVSAPDRDFLFASSDGRLLLWGRKFGLGDCNDVELDGANVSVCKVPNYGFQQFLKEIESKLVKAGIRVDDSALLGLMRRGFFGVGRPDWPETQRFVAELLRRGIPFVPTDSSSAAEMPGDDTETPTESAH